MNFFQQELRKIVGPRYPDATYIGRVCYVYLSVRRRAKIQIVSWGKANVYNAIQLWIVAIKSWTAWFFVLMMQSDMCDAVIPMCRGMGLTSWLMMAGQHGLYIIQRSGTIKSLQKRSMHTFVCFRLKSEIQIRNGLSPLCYKKSQRPYTLTASVSLCAAS